MRHCGHMQTCVKRRQPDEKREGKCIKQKQFVNQRLSRVMQHHGQVLAQVMQRTKQAVECRKPCKADSKRPGLTFASYPQQLGSIICNKVCGFFSRSLLVNYPLIGTESGPEAHTQPWARGPIKGETYCTSDSKVTHVHTFAHVCHSAGVKTAEAKHMMAGIEIKKITKPTKKTKAKNQSKHRNRFPDLTVV